MKMIKPRFSKIAAVAAMTSVCVMAWVFNVNAQLTNLALKKTTVTSGNEGTLSGSNAVDGDTLTRWGSAWQGVAKPDSAWIYIDFGKVATFDSIKIWWEHSNAVDYKIQTSNVATNTDQGWNTIVTVTNDTQKIQDNNNFSVHRPFKLSTPSSARYLKIRCSKRNYQWGYSIHELEVFNTLGPNRALKKQAYASSSNNGAGPEKAVDGAVFYPPDTLPQFVGQLNFNARWENNYGSRPDSLRGLDWLYVDLGAKYTVKYIVLLWEHSHSGDYVVQAWTKSGAPTAADTADANWTLLATDKNLTYSKPPDFCQGTYAVTPTETQFVRMHSYKKAQPYAEYAWGISIWEFEVYGTPGPTSISPSALEYKNHASNHNFIHTKNGVSLKTDAQGNLTADIFSPSGQLIRRLSGSSTFFWNYKDSFGRSVVNGTYLIKVTSAGKTFQDKITVNR
jgi:hypothetical protein